MSVPDAGRRGRRQRRRSGDRVGVRPPGSRGHRGRARPSRRVRRRRGRVRGGTAWCAAGPPDARLPGPADGDAAPPVPRHLAGAARRRGRVDDADPRPRASRGGRRRPQRAHRAADDLRVGIAGGGAARALRRVPARSRSHRPHRRTGPRRGAARTRRPAGRRHRAGRRRRRVHRSPRPIRVVVRRPRRGGHRGGDRHPHRLPDALVSQAARHADSTSTRDSGATSATSSTSPCRATARRSR